MAYEQTQKNVYASWQMAGVDIRADFVMELNVEVNLTLDPVEQNVVLSPHQLWAGNN
jgi:hypothetical protein